MFNNWYNNSVFHLSLEEKISIWVIQNRNLQTDMAGMQ